MTQLSGSYRSHQDEINHSYHWTILKKLDESRENEEPTIRLLLIPDRHNYCYLLQSTSKIRRTYFGVTLDLATRIKQHNGEIVGGAKTTRGGRPWKMIAYLSGFISRIEALRFEWRVHHPGMKWNGLTGRKKIISKVLREKKWLLGDKPRIITITWLEEGHHLDLLPSIRARCFEQFHPGYLPSG